MSKKLLKAVLVELQTLRVQLAGNVEGVKLSANASAAGTRPNSVKKNGKGKKQKEFSSDTSPTLFRYIRPIDPCTGEMDSQKGVTLKLNLDYKNRVVNFSYAICNHKKGEPSFNKKEGQRIASEKKVYSVPLWDVPGRLEDADITSFVLSAVANKKVDVPAGDRKNLIEQYNQSETNFWLDVE